MPQPVKKEKNVNVHIYNQCQNNRLFIYPTMNALHCRTLLTRKIVNSHDSRSQTTYFNYWLKWFCDRSKRLSILLQRSWQSIADFWSTEISIVAKTIALVFTMFPFIFFFDKNFLVINHSSVYLQWSRETERRSTITNFVPISWAHTIKCVDVIQF